MITADEARNLMPNRASETKHALDRIEAEIEDEAARGASWCSVLMAHPLVQGDVEEVLRVCGYTVKQYLDSSYFIIQWWQEGHESMLWKEHESP